ncbi:MAG: GNAT family N-acetyltransferase [Solidesulfovibrio sp.]
MTPQDETHIRPAAPDDAPAMADVFAAAIEGKAGASYGPRERAAWVARGSTARLTDMMADAKNRLLVAESNYVITGIAGLCGCEVSLLYTSPTAAPGTGARLLEAIETLARQLGQDGLTLTASRNALAFYHKHGYSVLRLASRPLPGDVALPVCVMVKTLGE